jgi:hypothetical protein
MSNEQSLSITDPERYAEYRAAIVAMAKQGLLSVNDHARFSNFQRTWVSPPALNPVDGAAGWNTKETFTFHPLASFMQEKYDTRGYYLYRFPRLTYSELVSIREEIEPYLRPYTPS